MALVTPVVATAQVSEDPDDPAIWIHPADPARSMILGTNKVKAPAGRWWCLGWTARSARRWLGSTARTTWTWNMDSAGGEAIDIAVVTERLKNACAYSAWEESGLTETRPGTRVFGTGRAMRRRRWASLSTAGRKTGLYSRSWRRRRAREKYLGQYRLENGRGR